MASFLKIPFSLLNFCRCASIQQLQFGTHPINFKVREDFELLLVFRPRQIFWSFVPFKIFSPQILHFWSRIQNESRTSIYHVFRARQMFWSFCRISMFLGIYIFWVLGKCGASKLPYFFQDSLHKNHKIFLDLPFCFTIDSNTRRYVLSSCSQIDSLKNYFFFICA